MVEYYYRLAHVLVEAYPNVPRDLRLRIGEPARQRAQHLLSRHDVGPKYVVLCPVAIGFHRGKVKGVGRFHTAERRVACRRHISRRNAGPE